MLKNTLIVFPIIILHNYCLNEKSSSGQIRISKSEIRNKFECQMTKWLKLKPWGYYAFVIGSFFFWLLFRISCFEFLIFDRKNGVFGQALTIEIKSSKNVSSFECSPKRYQARGSDCRSIYGDNLQKVRQEMCTFMDIKKSYRNGLRRDFYSGSGEV